MNKVFVAFLGVILLLEACLSGEDGQQESTISIVPTGPSISSYGSQDNLILPEKTEILPSPTPVTDISHTKLIYAASINNPGIITGLFVSNDRYLWIASDLGVVRIDALEDSSVMASFDGQIIGVDTGGNAWIISKDKEQISSWDGFEWRHYSSKNGWLPILSAKNTPLESYNFSVAPDGVIWVSTPRDIRRFKDGQWITFTLGGMGFNENISKRVSIQLTMVLSSFDQSVWVGLCYWEGDKPSGGQGVRNYKNGKWFAVPGMHRNLCVSTMNASRDGKVYAGTDGGIWIFQPNSMEALVWIPPGIPDSDLNYGYVKELPVDPDGEIWPLYALCGKAGCGLWVIRYHVRDDIWTQIDDLTTTTQQVFLFDRSDEEWIFTRNQIWRLKNDQVFSVDDVGIRALHQSLDGKIWVVGKYNNVDAVWYLQD